MTDLTFTAPKAGELCFKADTFKVYTDDACTAEEATPSDTALLAT